MRKIKKLGLVLGVVFFQSGLWSQVAIGKTSVDGDGLLDFATGTKGIVLSKVTTLTAQEGSMVFDAVENRVKYHNGNWVDLSTESGVSDITEQTLFNEVGEAVIIGSDSTTATGVLVLESVDKSLILPKVASPQLNVPSPSPGTICYDTDSKMLAVYNGQKWAFWGLN